MRALSLTGAVAYDVERAKAAPADLAALCRLEHPRLVGALGYYTGDSHLAEELAQDALLKLCQHWERVRTMESPGGWLHQVAINLAKSAYRRHKIGRSAEGRSASREMPIEDRDMALVVRDAVADLPQPMREVIVLRFFLDLSVAETARVVARPEATVKVMTSRAIKRLKSSGLSECFQETQDG